MQALVYTATNEVTVRDEPPPVAAAGEVLVQVEASGICGSDMHAYHGQDPRRVPPLVLGHEAAGIVQEGAWRGRRVVLNPLVTCGRCEDCLGGRPNLCRERELIGMRRAGALAELVAIPEANLIAVPEGMSPAHAALTEPAATALHAIALAARASHRPLAEGRALVIGGGAIGLLAALVLQSQGCRDLRLGDTNPSRRQTAAAVGITVYDPQDAGAVEPGSHALVIDAVGAAATRQAAIAAVGAGGIVLHIGLQDNLGGLDMRRITLSEITLIGTYTYTPIDLRAALRALHEGALGDLGWAETRPLAAGAAAFADLDAGRAHAAKIILEPAWQARSSPAQ